MNNLSVLLEEGIDVKTFIYKFKKLDDKSKNKVLKELNTSLGHLQTGYKELLNSLQEIKEFIALQQNIIEALVLEEDTPIINFSKQASTDYVDDYHNEVEVFEETKQKEDNQLFNERRGRGRTPLVHDIIQHFNLTQKAQNIEEEVERLKNLKSYNNWVNIGSKRTPHKIAMNGTYLASIQMLDANSKNANFSVLTRVMLNPTGAFFEGESVIIRNRYLETYEEAVDYMERQIKKISKQFFYEKAPHVIQNHGNRNSYYGFYLSKENRDNYKKALQLSK